MLPQREPPGKPGNAGWGSVLADGLNDDGETPYRQATSTAERFSPTPFIRHGTAPDSQFNCGT